MHFTNMSKIKLTIEYVGTNFCGWQSQTNGVSVQDTVEKALGNYFNCDPIRIYGAGRTDVGVHAKGQVAHFFPPKDVNPYKLCLGVNLSLPNSVAVVQAEKVTDDFDARFSAVSKTYCYRLYVSATRKPTLDVNHAQVYRPLNVYKMAMAAKMLEGTHDFASFQKTGSNLKGTVRTINSFDVVDNNDGTIDLVVNGNAFLYSVKKRRFQITLPTEQAPHFLFKRDGTRLRRRVGKQSGFFPHNFRKCLF